MRYSWKIGLPFLLAAATGALSALLTQLSAYHPATTTQAAIVGAALLIGDAIRSQLLIAEKRQPPDAPPVVSYVSGTTERFQLLPALPLVDPALLVGLVEDALRQHLANPHPVPTDPPPPPPETDTEAAARIFAPH